MTRLVGRSDLVDRLGEQLPRRRLITLVGPGGIGKTRAAIACAEALAASYRDGVGLVDLTAVTEPASIAAALATALGVATGSDEPLRDVREFLRERKMLLVIDTCEHVVHAAAGLVEAITMRAPGVHILATSRESLRVGGEWVRVVPRCPTRRTWLSFP